MMLMLKVKEDRRDQPPRVLGTVFRNQPAQHPQTRGTSRSRHAKSGAGFWSDVLEDAGRAWRTHSTGLVPSGPFLNWCLWDQLCRSLSTFCVFEEELGAAWRSVHMGLSAASSQQPKLKPPAGHAGPVPRTPPSPRRKSCPLGL